MRILFVWLSASVMIFTVTVGWYVSQPAVLGVAYAIKTSITNPTGQSIATLVEYASFWWGPLIDLFILLWAYVSSQRTEYESYAYE